MRSLWIFLATGCAGCGSSTADNEPAKPPGCDLAGLYRVRGMPQPSSDLKVDLTLRFRIENRGGSWVGVVVKPRDLEMEREVKIAQDGQQCSFSAAFNTRFGRVFTQLQVDPKTEVVKGTMRLEDARDGNQPMLGVRGGAAASTRTCVKPGNYKLVVPQEQEAWHGQEKHQSCDKAQLEQPLFVEMIGDQLVIEQLDDKGDIAGSTYWYSTDENCNVVVQLRRGGNLVATRLTFNGDQITAAPTLASVLIEDQGGHWTCTARSPMAWVTRDDKK